MTPNHDDKPNVPTPHPEGYGDPAPAEPYYPAYYAYDEPEGTDWRQITRLVWQRKWWIIGALALGVLAGWAVNRFTIPLYETSTTVWVEQTDPRGGAIRADDVLAGAGWASIYRSYAVMMPVVLQERLYLRPVEPRDPAPSLFAEFEVQDDVVAGLYELQVSSSGSWILSRPGEGTVETGDLGDPVGLAAGFRWMPPADANRGGSAVRFRIIGPRAAAVQVWNNLKVRYEPTASLISARLTWPDPAEAAEILNALNATFIEVATDLKSRKMREEVEILDEQARFVENQLQSAELALESHKIGTITLPSENNAVPIAGTGAVRDPVFGAYFDRRIEASQVEYDLGRLEEILAAARAGQTPNLTAIRFIPSAATDAPELAAAIEELQKKEVERRTLLYRYTEEWPDVQRLSDEIEALRTRTIPTLIAQLVEQLRDRLGTVNQQLAAQASELRQIPSRTIETTRRQREAEIHAQLYNNLKVRLNNARLAQATAELADMRVVDEAVPPRSPSSNEGPRLWLMASMAGLGLGVVGVLLYDRLDRRIRYPRQVTGTLGLPVLGVVPRLNGKRSPSGAAAAIAVEAFRSIRTQLARAGGPEGKVTMVTSPAPREGKSMVAANLAISCASAGCRTLLVDGDTRRGRAQEMFGLKNSLGLSDYLLERASLEEVVQETGVEGLWLLARGRLEGFNSDRLEGEVMDQLLDRLREEYDAVVIDAPPLAAGADALLLGERADKTLLVVRAGRTDEELAKTKLEMVGNVELHIVGTVLNAVPANAPYYNHYVSYYYADAEIGA